MSNLMFRSLEFAIRFFTCPVVTPVATETTGLCLKRHFSKAFADLTGHYLVSAFGDFAQPRGPPVESEANGIEDGCLPGSGWTGDGKNTVGGKGRMRQVDFPFTHQRVQILESYLQYLHRQPLYSACMSPS